MESNAVSAQLGSTHIIQAGTMREEANNTKCTLRKQLRKASYRVRGQHV